MLSPEYIEKLAKLSKLDLDPAAIANFQDELSKIIDFVEELEEVDTQGVEPTYYGNQNRNVYREDQPVQSHLSQAMLENTPAHSDGFIKVPVIIENEEV